MTLLWSCIGKMDTHHTEKSEIHVKYIVLVISVLSFGILWFATGLHDEIVLELFTYDKYGKFYNEIPKCYAQSLETMEEVILDYGVCIFPDSILSGVEGNHVVLGSCVWYYEGECQTSVNFPSKFYIARDFDHKLFMSLNDLGLEEITYEEVKLGKSQ